MELELRPDDVVGKVFYYGKGCENCNNTGYRGRMGIYEIMVLDDDMRDMIIKHASTQVLRAEATSAACARSAHAASWRFTTGSPRSRKWSARPSWKKNNSSISGF